MSLDRIKESELTPLQDSVPPVVSVCIVTYKRKALLRQCLDAVRRTIIRFPYEILVCDNNSGDGTEAMLREQDPAVRLVVNETNRGFAAANNELIRMSRGDFILLLNNDCVVSDGAIDKLVTFLLGRPEAGIVGGKILLPDGTIQASMEKKMPGPFANYGFGRFTRAKRQERFLATAELSRRKQRVSDDFIREQGYDRIQQVEFVFGAFMLVRRLFIQQCGMLDERYFMYCEDSDWCLRAGRAGWKIFYVNEAEAVHYHIHRASRRPERALLLEPAYCRSQLIFSRTRRGRSVTLVLALVLALIAAVRVGGALMLFPWRLDGPALSSRLRTQARVFATLAAWMRETVLPQRSPGSEAGAAGRAGTNRGRDGLGDS